MERRRDVTAKALSFSANLVTWLAVFGLAYGFAAGPTDLQARLISALGGFIGFLYLAIPTATAYVLVSYLSFPRLNTIFNPPEFLYKAASFRGLMVAIASGMTLNLFLTSVSLFTGLVSRGFQH